MRPIVIESCGNRTANITFCRSCKMLQLVAIGHIDPDLISECVVYIVPCVLEC